jgi:type IV secretory pathway VirB4 component/type IV secretory pathway TrbD component
MSPLLAFPGPSEVPGFAVPLHRSLTEPILLGGAPRAIAIAVGTLAASVGIGLQLWIAGLAIWIVGHAASVWLTRTEPQFIGVFGRHLQMRAPYWTRERETGMLDLREYRTRRVLLADYLPWAGLVAPGIVLNKDGSLQRTCRFRGPDLDSATDAELVAVCARLNNALKRLGSGWALFVEALRHEAAGYPVSRFPDPVSFLVDRERRAMFETEGAHFESQCFLTFAYLAPPESAERVQDLLCDSAGEKRGIDWREQLEAFRAETDRVTGLLEGVMPEIAWLDDSETLTYLHACVSTERHPIEMPPVPFYIDGLVADMPLVTGVEPMLGRSHLRTLTLRGFPNQTWPGLLGEMNRLPLAYRWVARWLPFDKPVALKEIERKRRHWYAKRKGIAALLRETLWGKESPLVDSDAENQAMDADAALQELGADYVACGLFTATVTLWDEDHDRVADKVKSVGRVLRSRGFVVAEETLNAVDAWLSSLPGQCYANLRQPPVSSLNLVHMVPLSSVWAGPERNEHLEGAAAACPDRRRDAIPAGAPSRRCRAHARRRADRRRKIGSAQPARPAVPALREGADLSLRQGPLVDGVDPWHGRELL